MSNQILGGGLGPFVDWNLGLKGLWTLPFMWPCHLIARERGEAPKGRERWFGDQKRGERGAAAFLQEGGPFIDFTHLGGVA